MPVNNRASQVRMILNKVSSIPFKFGSMDCCLFLNEVSIAIAGVDHSSKFPIYDEYSYEVLLETYGGVEGIATMCLGDPVAVEELQVGDCVLVGHDTKSLLSIYDGSKGVFVKTDGGVIHVALEHATMGWHI